VERRCAIDVVAAEVTAARVIIVASSLNFIAFISFCF
jgi:hypothetical protein